MRLINKLLHKKHDRSLHGVRSVLDLFVSTFEPSDDARFARKGEWYEY